MTPVRVVVADDSTPVRRALVRLLDGAGLHVVGEAADGDELLAAVSHASPDVVLVDLWLADGSAVQAIRTLRAARPPVPCVLLTASPDHQAALAATVGGCAARLAKSGLVGDDLVDVLRRATSSPGAAAASRSSVSLPDADPLLRLLLDGRTDAEIAAALGLGAAEVAQHVSGWLARLGLGRVPVSL